MNYTLLIEKDGILQDLLRYIYENYDVLETQNIVNYKTKPMEVSSQKCNKGYNYHLSFGTYEIIFDGTLINVDYKKEGNPKACYERIIFYERVILSSNNESVIKKFMTHVYTESRKVLSDETICIFIPESSSGEWIKYQEIPTRNMSSIYIDEKSKKKIMNDITRFKNSEHEYNNFGIPYKRTYLFSGPPGTGKSSFVKAICNELNCNLSILSLSKKFDDESFLWAMSTLKKNTVLLVEDIDCLFEKRSSSEFPLTFSNFLNVLDGVLYNHGCIMFLTTNHPEKLDHALLRIGRVDCVLEFEYPKKNEIKKLFFDITKLDDKEFTKFFDNISGKKLPMSAIVHYLFLNKEKWNDNIDELLNTNYFFKKSLKDENSDKLYL